MKKLGKIALITGISGQDGSYLAELLLEKDYEVHGIVRRHSVAENQTARLDGCFDNDNLHLHYGDVTDISSLCQIIQDCEPIEIYNIAAQSHVRISFDIPVYTVTTTGLGPLNVLEAVRIVNPHTKIYQASSSEMFGDNPDMPKNGFTEESRLMPASPYACAKVFAHNLVRNYRESYNLHASSGILFNHESPRRGETFVTRKITIAANKIKLGLQDKLFLGNLDAKRDWGYAGDYVKAMWLMLQEDEPDDYVISTGESYSVRNFLEIIFDHANLGNYEDYVEIDPRLYRPHEVPILKGDSSKAKEKLEWEPEISFDNLARMMYDEDYKLISKEI